LYICIGYISKLLLMKRQGRQGCGNIEDRRGMGRGRKMIGGGSGTLVILIIILLLGGDPSGLLNVMDQGSIVPDAFTHGT
jgi:uncharacterized protein